MFERANRQNFDPNPDARAAGAALIKEGVDAGGRRKPIVYNRLEGNALDTIAGMLEQADIDAA